MVNMTLLFMIEDKGFEGDIAKPLINTTFYLVYMHIFRLYESIKPYLRNIG